MNHSSRIVTGNINHLTVLETGCLIIKKSGTKTAEDGHYSTSNRVKEKKKITLKKSRKVFFSEIFTNFILRINVH